MKKLFFLLCLSFVLTSFSVAYAADSGCSGFEAQFSFLSNGGGVDPTSGLPKICTAGSAISWITNMALGFAGVVAVVFIIVGGYMFLTSAGNEEAAEKGRKVLTNSIIGLIIIILSATIVRVVVNTLDTGGTGSTPSVTSTITYPSATGTPSGSGGGLTNQDRAALKGGFTVSSSQVTASISKANESKIKAACGVTTIGNNVSFIVDIRGKPAQTSKLSLSGSSYTGTISLASGVFDSQNDCMFISVCEQEVGFWGECQ